MCGHHHMCRVRQNGNIPHDFEPLWSANYARQHEMPFRCVELNLVSVEDGSQVTDRGAQAVLHVRRPSVFRERWENAEVTKELEDETFFSMRALATLGSGSDLISCGPNKDVMFLSNGENLSLQRSGMRFRRPAGWTR